MVDTRLTVTPSRLFKPGDAFKPFAQSNDDKIISSLTLPKVQSQHVKSGDRALKVIELFYHLRRPSKASEISDGLGIPRSSAHELLHTLVDTGFLTFDHKRRTYFPSLRIVRLCQWLSPFYFGGTSLLIVIGVGLDTAQQIESHMLMRNYEGFLAKGRLKGRSG